MKVSELIEALMAMETPELEVLIEGSEDEDDYIEVTKVIHFQNDPKYPKYVVIRR